MVEMVVDVVVQDWRQPGQHCWLLLVRWRNNPPVHPINQQLFSRPNPNVSGYQPICQTVGVGAQRPFFQQIGGRVIPSHHRRGESDVKDPFAPPGTYNQHQLCLAVLASGLATANRRPLESLCCGSPRYYMLSKYGRQLSAHDTVC